MDLDALLTREEAPHPDLAAAIQPGPLGQMIHHPLIIETFLTVNKCGLVNARYTEKLAAVENARLERKFSPYVFLHERPYRLDALTKLLDDDLLYDPAVYWPLVAQVWIDSENIWQNIEQWNYIWTAMSDSLLAMSDADRESFLAMKNMITVYRGLDSRGTREGMSWTTDRKKAEWFSKRFSSQDRTPVVLTASVAKRDVLAYFTNRGENEIVVLPESLLDVCEV